MTAPFQPDLRIAIVRFSALGDVVMVSAAVRALQQCLPAAKITWITSPLTYSLLKGMEGVQFEVFEKPRSLADYFAFYRAFRERRFDVVLAMQANLRINLLYPALRAPVKIGFDRIRSREGQWLFCNRRIPFADSHLVDSFLSFVETLTCKPASADWNLPVGSTDLEWAYEQLSTLSNGHCVSSAPDDIRPRNFTFPPTLLRQAQDRPSIPRRERENGASIHDDHDKYWVAIHPHSSKTERNWLPERYEELVKQVVARWKCGVVLSGGSSAAELSLCERLAQLAPGHTINLCGKSTLKQLAALLSLVDVLIAPDTGSVHIARAMNTPVIGLYAVASPKLSGPYRHLEYCVDRYPEAVNRYLGKDAGRLPWNTRVHDPRAMSLITVADVMSQLDKVLRQRV